MVLERVPQLWLEPLGAQSSGEELLSLQERRWGAALPEPRRGQYGASRAALRLRLAPLLGCEPAELPLEAPPGQPPRLANGAGCLGLSHSGSAVLIAWSPSPIGVDLERSDRAVRARALMARFFPGLECQQLESLAPDRLHEAVLRSWVLKEAAIKWRWRTLARELAHWRFDHLTGELCQDRERLAPPWRAGLVGRWRWAAVGAGVERLQLHPAPALMQPAPRLTSDKATRILQKTNQP